MVGRPRSQTQSSWWTGPKSAQASERVLLKPKPERRRSPCGALITSHLAVSYRPRGDLELQFDPPTWRTLCGTTASSNLEASARQTPQRLRPPVFLLYWSYQTLAKDRHSRLPATVETNRRSSGTMGHDLRTATVTAISAQSRSKLTTHHPEHCSAPGTNMNIR